MQLARAEQDPRRAVEVERLQVVERGGGAGRVANGGRYAVGSCNWSARPRNRKSMRFPSCGCNQFSFVVEMGPRFSRSMFVALIAAFRSVSSLLMTVPTSVAPIRLIISACGHSTTAANGNIYSFCATGV